MNPLHTRKYGSLPSDDTVADQEAPYEQVKHRYTPMELVQKHTPGHHNIAPQLALSARSYMVTSHPHQWNKLPVKAHHCLVQKYLPLALWKKETHAQQP